MEFGVLKLAWFIYYWYVRTIAIFFVSDPDIYESFTFFLCIEIISTSEIICS